MSHETPTISAEQRQRIGSRYAKRLRSGGKLPAIIYGHETDPLAVSVDHQELIDYLQDGAHVFNLAIDGTGEQTCLVKDLQFGYLGDNVIHVDFTRVDLDEEVTVNVHLNFHGEPKALEEAGAILRQGFTELEVICKVRDIPDEIRVDISEMEDNISVGEIELPRGVRTDLDPETSVVQIAFVEEVEEPEEAELVDLEAEPEVITEAGEEEDTEGAEEGEEEAKPKEEDES